MPSPIVYNVTDSTYAGGAVGNNVADDTAAIQAAINAAQSAQGGIVFFPPGTYRTSSTLQVSASNVRLLGSGPGGIHSNVPEDPATRINYYGGAAPAIQFAPAAGTHILAGNGCANLSTYNWGTGTIGLNVDTCQFGFYDGIVSENFSVAQIAMQQTIVTPDSTGAQQNHFQRWNVATPPGGSAIGLWINQSSHNTFITGTYSHAAGGGIVINNSDRNVLISMRGNRAGAIGIGLHLTGAGTISTFINMLTPGPGGVTADAHTTGTMLNYDSGDNASPNPVIDPTASFFWSSDNGFINNFRTGGMNFFGESDVGNGVSTVLVPGVPFVANDNLGNRGLILNVAAGARGVALSTAGTLAGLFLLSDGGLAAKYVSINGAAQLTNGNGPPAFAAPIGTFYANNTGSLGSLLYVATSAAGGVSAWHNFV
jgi:hypothetical protein